MRRGMHVSHPIQFEFNTLSAEERERLDEIERAKREARLFTPSGASATDVGQMCHLAMKRALGGLGKREQVILALHYVERMTHEEVACAMGVGPGELRCMASEALEKLRRRFAISLALKWSATGEAHE